MALNTRILCFIGLLALSLAACRRSPQGAGLPDLRLTLAPSDTKPMGGKVFRTMAATLYSDTDIENNAKPFDAWYRNYLQQFYHEEASLYLLVTPILSMRKKEAEELHKFVSSGNQVLVVTNGVSPAFSATFGVQINELADTITTNFAGLRDTYKITPDENGKAANRYGYYFKPFLYYLDSIKDGSHEVYSFNTRMFPDGIKQSIGEGEIILVTNAEAFGNYFLLTDSNYLYGLGLLNHFSKWPGAVYWDDFYRRNTLRGEEDLSVFDAILSQPALKWAFWLLLLISAVAIFTNLFRRQRIIPLRVPNRNTTVEFTNTIARLYYNKRDNRNIAQKMVLHFLENMRSTYYIPHQKLDHSFAVLLAGKTNQPLPKMERLVQRMAAIMQGAEVSDDLLLELNRQLTELTQKRS